MPDRFRRGPTSTWKTGWVTVALRLGLDPVRTYSRLRRPGGFSKALVDAKGPSVARGHFVTSSA